MNVVGKYTNIWNFCIIIGKHPCSRWIPENLSMNALFLPLLIKKTVISSKVFCCCLSLERLNYDMNEIIISCCRSLHYDCDHRYNQQAQTCLSAVVLGFLLWQRTTTAYQYFTKRREKNSIHQHQLSEPIFCGLNQHVWQYFPLWEATGFSPSAIAKANWTNRTTTADISMHQVSWMQPWKTMAKELPPLKEMPNITLLYK